MHTVYSRLYVLLFLFYFFLLLLLPCIFRISFCVSVLCFALNLFISFLSLIWCRVSRVCCCSIYVFRLAVCLLARSLRHMNLLSFLSLSRSRWFARLSHYNFALIVCLLIHSFIYSFYFVHKRLNKNTHRDYNNIFSSIFLRVFLLLLLLSLVC